MVATGADAASAPGDTAYAIAGRTSDAVERQLHPPAERLVEAVRAGTADGPDRGRPAGDSAARRLELLDERGGIGHDLDVVGPALLEEDRHARRADLVRAKRRAARAERQRRTAHGRRTAGRERERMTPTSRFRVPVSLGQFPPRSRSAART